MKPATLIILFLAALYALCCYRPVCHATNANLVDGGKCYPLYACERMGWVEYLGE